MQITGLAEEDKYNFKKTKTQLKVLFQAEFEATAMPDWLFEKKEIRNTPSARDGIDYETECRYRRDGARFISDVGLSLNL